MPRLATGAPLLPLSKELPVKLTCFLPISIKLRHLYLIYLPVGYLLYQYTTFATQFSTESHGIGPETIRLIALGGHRRPHRHAGGPARPHLQRARRRVGQGARGGAAREVRPRGTRRQPQVGRELVRAAR